MKIVFLTSSYYPYSSAIGKCVYNLVSELKTSNEVVVISNMSLNKGAKTEVYDGHEIIRVRTKRMMERDELLSKQSSNFLSTIITKIKINSSRLGGYLKTVFSENSVEKALVKEYYNSLINIDDIDLIVPTCYPFESIVAAQLYQEKINKKVKIIPILFDKFSDSPTLHRNELNKKIKYKRHLMLEEEMITRSDKVMYVDSWISAIKQLDGRFQEKLIHIEHPLVVDQFSEITLKKRETSEMNIVVTYTGVLDRKVRPPSETLKIIEKIIKTNKIFKFHFYALGNGVDEVKLFAREFPENIFFHGQVNSEDALSRIKHSDILLSIGNTDISLIPSKIFEYMSSGKPIVHFYHTDEDSVINILKEYELGYCLNQNESVDISAFINFCVSKSGYYRTFEDVSKTFYKATPSYIAGKLLKNVNNKKQ